MAEQAGVKGDSSAATIEWPAATQRTRPWTRWWWLGSAVDEAGITRQLELFQQAGIGGVEICPIYGAKGAESRFIEFLSPRWMEMLAHTIREAERLGLGVDLTTGTGWPFGGGPNVTAERASCRLVLKTLTVEGGQSVSEKLAKGQVVYAGATDSAGQQIDVSSAYRDGQFEWTAPAGQWRVHLAISEAPVQKVKRAAPGGEGNVVDPYSTSALEAYLARFDEAFAASGAPKPAGHFHDSFEYYGATWTGDFLEQFRRRRGYDLAEHWPAMFGEGDADTVARVKYDYRRTIGELHLDYIRRWVEWGRGHGGVARNQAHGAPGNLIDLYAAADIPETEVFGEVDERTKSIVRLASSAAHLTARPLASSESFTWLGEHFNVTLAEAKAEADYLFLNGINHIFFHGIPYSPADAEWPGWLFYASTHMGPEGGLWRDQPAFNAYLTRVQSVLQAGRPDNDVLVYFPVHDLWQKADEGQVIRFEMPGKWMWETPFHAISMQMAERGYAFDCTSDAFLNAASVSDGAVRIGDGEYRVVLVPGVKVMPAETLRRLIELAGAGATVLVQGELPADVPGLYRLEERRREMRELLDGLAWRDEAGGRVATVGKGRIIVAGDALAALERLGVAREAMADRGLRCIRRKRNDGFDYFVVNRDREAFEGWVKLARPAHAAVWMDPRFADRGGAAAVTEEGEVYLQLAAGESVVLRTSNAAAVSEGDATDQPAYVAFGRALPLAGTWQVVFIEGGPVLPQGYETPTLGSWTDAPDAEAKRFAGTARYTLRFEHDPAGADDWWLDLGRVCESARVRVNGHEAGMLFAPPWHLPVGHWLKAGANEIEIEVTNVAANRIADLDRRGVEWKRFHEINFVNRQYKPFDASNWPVRASGLMGPVHLVAAQAKRPDRRDRSVYLFSYFVGNGEDGLHLAWSEDGLKFEPLNGGRSFLTPQVGESKLMRDPFLARDKDGMFHLVWTTSWTGKTIGYASSRDLVNWSEQRAIEVMGHEPTVKNTWAPEMIYDEQTGRWVIFWASTIPGRFPEHGQPEKGFGHRMYYTTTEDFKTFAPAQLFYDPGFSVIDATFVRAADGLYLIVKDETGDPPKKHLRIAKADGPTGPFRDLAPPFTRDWVEGPTAIRVGEHYMVYYDCYTDHCYGAMRSRDMRTWEDASHLIRFPDGARHGTVLEVPREVVDRLKAQTAGGAR